MDWIDIAVVTVGAAYVVYLIIDALGATQDDLDV